MIETEVKGKGPEAVTHIPSIFSRVSLLAFLTHRPPDPRGALRRTAGLRWTLASADFPMSGTAYIPHHSKSMTEFPIISHLLEDSPLTSHPSQSLLPPSPLSVFLLFARPPISPNQHSPEGHARRLFQANLGHPGDGEKSQSVQLG